MNFFDFFDFPTSEWNYIYLYMNICVYILNLYIYIYYYNYCIQLILHNHIIRQYNYFNILCLRRFVIASCVINFCSLCNCKCVCLPTGSRLPRALKKSFKCFWFFIASIKNSFKIISQII